MKRSRLLMFYVGMMLVGVLAVACASGEVASGESPTATPTPVAPDPTSAPTSVPPTLVNEQVREIPPLLLSESPPHAAVQLSFWVEYLQGGILRSLDGRQSLEVCTGTDDSLKGTATGDLLMEDLLDGDKWGAQPQFAQPGSGWDHSGLVFGGPSLAEIVLVGYNLQLIDGVPTLVHNPDATHPFADATSPYWRVPEIKVMPFEVIDGADCP